MTRLKRIWQKIKEGKLRQVLSDGRHGFMATGSGTGLP